VRNGLLNFAYKHYYFYSCRKDLLHAVNLRHGFLSSLKIHRPRSGSNPRTLGPVARTLTTSPPRSTGDNLIKENEFSTNIKAVITDKAT
jgi:hypothetical protein